MASAKKIYCLICILHFFLTWKIYQKVVYIKWISNYCNCVHVKPFNPDLVGVGVRCTHRRNVRPSEVRHWRIRQHLHLRLH